MRLQYQNVASVQLRSRLFVTQWRYLPSDFVFYSFLYSSFLFSLKSNWNDTPPACANFCPFLLLFCLWEKRSMKMAIMLTLICSEDSAKNCGDTNLNKNPAIGQILPVLPRLTSSSFSAVCEIISYIIPFVTCLSPEARKGEQTSRHRQSWTEWSYAEIHS